ncbi:unannotated protein [freshwater metagenome]|uniref:Unannotated protein n=1 Tax=freshwater metagenome TaxID=449393 RepID=A0A6J7RPY0_9ZZZZ
MPVVEEAQRVVGQRAASFDRCCHLSELVADRLEVANRATESLPLRRIEQCLVKDELHRGDGAERHHQPLPLEVGHDQLEALVDSPEQVFGRHKDLIERDQRRVGGVPAHLLELRSAVAGLVGVNDEERDAAVAALGRCFDGHHDKVGSNAVRDVALLAADNPAAVNLFGVRAQRRYVGAGIRFGDPQRGDLRAGN